MNYHSLLDSYPDLLTPAFVTCSTNTGGGLVKLSHVQWRTWTYGGVAHSQKNHKELSALPIANTDRRTTERLTSDSSGNISWVQKATLQLYRRNVPLIHTSRYVTACDSGFTRPSALVLQATNAWVRRSGYEATHYKSHQLVGMGGARLHSSQFAGGMVKSQGDDEPKK